MPSNNLLTGEDPSRIAERAFAFDWSRSIGKGRRWWNEEIYSGMARGGSDVEETDGPPRELTTLLWMTLAHGAAGAMFWQYRPDHVAFESPGYNLADLGRQADSAPRGRFRGNIADRGVSRSTCPCGFPRQESQSSTIKRHTTSSA